MCVYKLLYVFFSICEASELWAWQSVYVLIYLGQSKIPQDSLFYVYLLFFKSKVYCHESNLAIYLWLLVQFSGFSKQQGTMHAITFLFLRWNLCIGLFVLFSVFNCWRILACAWCPWILLVFLRRLGVVQSTTLRSTGSLFCKKFTVWLALGLFKLEQMLDLQTTPPGFRVYNLCEMFCW